MRRQEQEINEFGGKLNTEAGQRSVFKIPKRLAKAGCSWNELFEG
jgi:hypothetical protein